MTIDAVDVDFEARWPSRFALTVADKDGTRTIGAFWVWRWHRRTLTVRVPPTSLLDASIRISRTWPHWGTVKIYRLAFGGRVPFYPNLDEPKTYVPEGK